MGVSETNRTKKIRWPGGFFFGNNKKQQKPQKSPRPEIKLYSNCRPYCLKSNGFSPSALITFWRFPGYFGWVDSVGFFLFGGQATKPKPCFALGTGSKEASLQELQGDDNLVEQYEKKATKTVVFRDFSGMKYLGLWDVYWGLYGIYRGWNPTQLYGDGSEPS